MSWHDCHIGYALLILPCYLLGFPWSKVGVIAGLNAGYAAAFTGEGLGNYSRPLWGLALFTSVVVLFIFTMLEITVGRKAGFPIWDVLAIVVAIKLAMGQFAFLLRIHREASQYDRLKDLT
jgi:hypothetical protein